MAKTITNGKNDSTESQAQQKATRIFRHQIGTLTQFITRLSKLYEGVMPDVDSELDLLNQYFTSPNNFDDIESQINLLTGIVLQNRDRIKTHNNQLLRLFETALRNIQIRENVSDSLKQEIGQIMAMLQNSGIDIANMVPQTQQLIDLLLHAIDLFESGSGNNKGNNGKKPVEIKQLHKRINHELLEITSHLQQWHPKYAELSVIHRQLLRGLNEQELLRCCLVTLKYVVQELGQEKRETENFVAGLNNALQTTGKTLTDTIQSSETQYQLKMANSQELRSHILDIGTTVDEGIVQASLKQQAAEYLAKMSATLDDREQVDREEQLKLMTLLSEMQNQLADLEKETATYKEKLKEQSHQNQIDPLTQVPNRRAYNERMQLEFRRWKRYKQGLCLAVIDIDHFKSINDNYGHAAGDKTLQVIAKSIAKSLRSTDFLARWGGEEFVVLLPDTELGNVERPLEDIRRHIENLPFKFKNKSVTITASIGATGFKAGENIEMVFERADAALYEAKNAGRNRCVVKA